MSEDLDSTAVVKDAFDDVALLIGTVAAARKLPDDVVRILVTRLGRVRMRTLNRLSGEPLENTEPRPLHPAVEEFLRKG